MTHFDEHFDESVIFLCVNKLLENNNFEQKAGTLSVIHPIFLSRYYQLIVWKNILTLLIKRLAKQKTVKETQRNNTNATIAAKSLNQKITSISTVQNMKTKQKLILQKTSNLKRKPALR